MTRLLLAVSAAAVGVAAVRLAVWFDAHITVLLDEGWRTALRRPARRAASAWGLRPVDVPAAVLAAAVVPAADRPAAALAAVVLGGCLAVSAWIDWRHRIIPDLLSLPLLAAGLAVSATPAALADWSAAWPGALLGLALGGAVRWLGGGLGWGDVKLLAAIGAWVGAVAICPLFLLSCGLMAVPLAWRRQSGGEGGLPMAPMLAFVTLPVALVLAETRANGIYLSNKLYSIIFLSCYP
ncbi:MAG TPA: prepilin peptidase [Rhodospirillaceae bacterium]|nr:prepilin peptidase [Rhodospirillaceae bacterium]